MQQVLGVENRGFAALGGVQDQGIPVRELVPRFDPKRRHDRLRSVDDDAIVESHPKVGKLLIIKPRISYKFLYTILPSPVTF
jgi:hypothetical protein